MTLPSTTYLMLCFPQGFQEEQRDVEQESVLGAGCRVCRGIGAVPEVPGACQEFWKGIVVQCDFKVKNTKMRK